MAGKKEISLAARPRPNVMTAAKKEINKCDGKGPMRCDDGKGLIMCSDKKEV